jgi:hypothetical protein
MKSRTLYLSWISANGFGELIGLGLTFVIGFTLTYLVGNESGVWGSLVMLAAYTFTGVIEGTVLGLFQWRAFHPTIPRIPRSSWWKATSLGAVIAWFAGSLPFIIINTSSMMTQANELTGQQPSQEPAQWMVMLMASAIGLLAGAVLALFQWLVLRQFVHKASWWLLANAFAWSAGMPIIFLAIDIVMKISQVWQKIILGCSALFLTGALVGAIHGLFLVWLAKNQI